MKARRLTPLLFLSTLVFYVVTLQPSLAWGDGIRLQREAITAESFILAEMVDVSFAPDPWPFARLGVAAWDHPLYVIIGHLLTQSLPMVDPLWLVNALSALFGAGTVALFFHWCHRHSGSQTGALFAAAALAVSHTFWWHAVTPEVYTLFAFLLLLTVLFYERYEESGRQRHLYAAAFVLGLGAANHLLALLLVPALLLARIEFGDRRLANGSQSPISNLQSLSSAAFFFLLGFSPYVIQFLRLLRTFPLEEVMGPAVGTTFLQGSLALAPGALGQSLLSYAVFLLYQFSPIGVLLGLYGWRVGRRLAPKLWRSALALYAVYLLFGLVYRVSDQFAFFLAAHLFWAVALGLGTARAAARLAASRRRWLAVGLALHVAAMPLLYAAAPGALRAAGAGEETLGVPQIGTGVRDGLAYYLNPNKRGERAAYTFGRETLQQLPPDALVIAEWYVDTDEYFVLRYFVAVEGMRPDVEIAGWPTVDPFHFEADLVLQRVEAALPQRPVYLASLDEEFYAAPQLLARYCIRPQHGLYRVTPRPGADEHDCLSPSQSDT
jgi:hypothetical protein